MARAKPPRWRHQTPFQTLMQVLPAKERVGAHLADFGPDGSRTQNSKGKPCFGPDREDLVTFYQSVIMSPPFQALWLHLISHILVHWYMYDICNLSQKFWSTQLMLILSVELYFSVQDKVQRYSLNGRNIKAVHLNQWHSWEMQFGQKFSNVNLWLKVTQTLQLLLQFNIQSGQDQHVARLYILKVQPFRIRPIMPAACATPDTFRPLFNQPPSHNWPECAA